MIPKILNNIIDYKCPKANLFFGTGVEIMTFF